MERRPDAASGSRTVTSSVCSRTRRERGGSKERGEVVKQKGKELPDFFLPVHLLVVFGGSWVSLPHTSWSHHLMHKFTDQACTK